MRTRVLLGTAGLAGVTILLGQLSVEAGNEHAGAMVDGGPATAGQMGPDVIVGDLQSTRRWSSNTTETSYSIGTTSCNIGDTTLDWRRLPDVRHPVIGQTMYRLSEGRFEQIGQSWLKHSFCALQQGICGDCQGGGGCQNVLHPMCSDPYTATRNGGQSGLGPKWVVNSHTGEFPNSWDAGEGTSGEYRRRIRVLQEDLRVEGATYFIEGQYVTLDDASFGNQNNNASYREVTVQSSLDLTFNGSSTQRGMPVIQAWQDYQATVTLVEVQVDEDGAPDGKTGLYEDGLMIVGYDVYDNGDGTWDYEYAVQNLNSHRSAKTFVVLIPDGVTVTNMDFHDVGYHSGDGIDGTNFDGTDWSMVVSASEARWEADLSAGDNSNALRWGTTYNFRFTADAGPAPTTATLDLYRADESNPDFNAVSLTVDGPAGATLCEEDLDSSGAVDFGDILMILTAWGNAGGPEDLDGSGLVDFGDILVVLTAWGPCPS